MRSPSYLQTFSGPSVDPSPGYGRTAAADLDSVLRSRSAPGTSPAPGGHDRAPGTGGALTIGASEVATILGLGRTRRGSGEPYTSPVELWARLSGLLPRYDTAPAGPDAELGHVLEPLILTRYGVLEQVAVVPGNAGIDTPGLTYPGIPWHAHLDGWCVTRSHPVEAKAPRDLDPDDGWGDAGTDQLPPAYAVQVTCQIALAHRLYGSDRGDLAALARAPRERRIWAVYTLRRNARREQRIASEVERWLDRYVRAGTCPPVDGSESASYALRRIWAPAEDRVVLAEPGDLERWRSLVSCRTAIEELQGRAEELRQGLQVRMRDATALHAPDGTKLATWRANKHGARSFRVKGD